jgi:hypothetical protein
MMMMMIIIIINMNSDRCGNTNGWKCHLKGSRKGIKIQKFVCRDTKNVQNVKCVIRPVILSSHRHVNKRVKEKLRRHARKTFSSFITTDSFAWNVTNNTERAAV